jgi:hypothetical protein
MRYLLAPHLERPTRTIDRRDLERLLQESEREEDEHERLTVPRMPAVKASREARR